MHKFGTWVVKYRIPILILALLLLIPSVFGMVSTRINYDILTYLPSDIETMVGQDILMDEFGKGGFSMVMIEGMDQKSIAALKEQMETIEHVDTVLWYNSLADITLPMEILPDAVYDAFNKGDTTLMAVFFNSSTSADETIEAVAEMRKVAGEHCFISGMSAMVTDLKSLCEQEEPIYVGIAVLLATLCMMLFLDSWLLPFLFLASIGMAILYNLGTNILFGEISYITKALAAILQLAVTMDYSIFLWHSYSEECAATPEDRKGAMARAINETLTSVTGSSVTTIAGFLAMCFMSFTLGKDLGVVMAKGVVLGVISCVTVLPALILLFDKAIRKTSHRPLLPKVDRLSAFIVKHAKVFLILFLVLLIPSFYGYQHTNVYYNLSETLPEDMDFIIANTKLEDTFDMASTHMVLADAALSGKETRQMMEEMEQVEGVKLVMGFNSVLGAAVPEEMVPQRLTETLKSENYQLILVSSEYKVASEEVNTQIDRLNALLKSYDERGMLIGEAPCTKDLIHITDHDFKVVDIVSVAAIFLIIAVVLQSALLPVLLVAVIELAIFINLGIPCYTGTVLCFVAPICISTIQLGATVDYAILMTTRYKKERRLGAEKQAAVTTALSTSIPSILVSALGFFAATFGVSVYSKIDLIASLCTLMARGAIISMLSVVFLLPSMLLLFDKAILKTTRGMKGEPGGRKPPRRTPALHSES